ncbi:MAG TPA: sensor histidine kinase [Candidatus Dormibacteraeota bacterium]|nr:sensor histidine kinase [Candidatus Dormibacteraeota bacterium]
MIRSASAWRRAGPAGLDFGLAALIAGAALVLLWLPPAPRSGSSPVSLVLVLAATLPLVRRRQHPYPVFVIVGMAALAHVALGYQNDFPVTFGVLVALFTVAQYSPRRLAWIAAAQVALLLPVNFGLDWSHQHQVVLSDIPFNYGLFVSAWVLGDDLRQRRLRLRELQARAVRMEEEHAERLRRARDLERVRISRELHDVIAHSVTVMVVQAGGARRIARQQPGQAERALEEIERVGRAAMSDTRRLLGLTRDGGEGPIEPPQPRLADLPQLVERTRGTGIEVELSISGEQRQLPEGLELSAYRIIQESLTNVIKHSGARSARVVVDFLADELRVEVTDDGSQAATGDGMGHGLIGIRERAELYGGTVVARATEGRGWRVTARLPLGAEA